MMGCYKLYRKVGNEWYYWGTYITVEKLAEASCYLGSQGIKEVKVEVITE